MPTLPSLPIAEIHLSTGRTFNHPFERYANLRFDIKVVIHADAAGIIVNGFDDNKFNALLAAGEQRAEQHKADILHDLEVQQQHTEAQRELAKAEQWTARRDAAIDNLNQIYSAIASISEWPAMTKPRRSQLIEFAYGPYGGGYLSGHETELSESQAGRLADDLNSSRKTYEKAAQTEEAEGPGKVAAARAKLAALPKLRLLQPLDVEKEIHPGHPDHPETGESPINEDDD